MVGYGPRVSFYTNKRMRVGHHLDNSLTRTEKEIDIDSYNTYFLLEIVQTLVIDKVRIGRNLLKGIRRLRAYPF